MRFLNRAAVGLFTALVLLFATAPFAAAEDAKAPARLYAAPTGPNETESANLELRDEARDKQLRLRVTWPKAKDSASDSAGKLPVIVYSHGAGGSCDAYTPLIECWASHGYVVIQPTHGDSISLLSAEERREITSAQDFLRSPNVLLQAMARPEDIRFVIDSLAKIEEEIPALKGKLDAARLGMGGHSYGAHTTQLISGLSLRGLLGRRRKAEDARPKALLMISPQGTGRTIDAESFTGITRPVLMITGSEDDSPTGQPASWRLEAWEHFPAGEKFLLFIEGAHHNFGGISGVRYPGAGRDNPEHVDWVRTTSLAFWDAYLLEESTARDYLAGDTLKKASEGKAEIKRK